MLTIASASAKKKELKKSIDELISKYPQYYILDEEVVEYPELKTSYEHACFMSIQMYANHEMLLLPIMLPGGSYVFEGIHGTYGNIDYEMTHDGMRLWKLVKFSPINQINREISGKISFTLLK